MRWPFFILTCIAAIELVALPSGVPGRSAGRELLSEGQRLLHVGEIRFEGLTHLDEGYLQEKLPLERSLFWWYLNRNKIASNLLTEPYLKEAHVTPCEEAFSFRCFKVSLVERKVSFLLTLHNEEWLVGEDGVLMTPLSGVESGSVLEEHLRTMKEELVELTLRPEENESPDAVRGRLAYVAGVLPVLSSEVRRKVKKVDARPHGELSVWFQDLDFPVIFDYSGVDLSVLGEEARRLSLLLSKFSGKEHLIKVVDLAFRNVAVVELKDGTKTKHHSGT